MKVFFTPYIYILLFLLQNAFVFAQHFELQLQSTQASNTEVIHKLSYKKIHDSRKSILAEIDSALIQLERKGFIYAKLNSLKNQDSIYTAKLNLGEKIETISINYGSLAKYPNILKNVNSKSNTNNQNSFTIPFDKVSNILQSIVASFEKQGISFITVHLDNIVFDKNTATADLEISNLKERTIDKITIKGYEKFPKNFIRYNLGLKKGSVFNEEKLANSSKAVNRLNFVTEQKTPEVLFTNDSTHVYLYLNKTKANKFDGVIGFASKENGNGISFNGYVDLEFHNIFNSGETIDLFWKNNGNDSQRFFLTIETPYIFNLPITPKVNFELYRQDSTFNNINTNIDLRFIIKQKHNVSLAYTSENSTNLLKNQITTPSIESYDKNLIGIKYAYELPSFDPIFKNKFAVNFSSFFGNRKTDTEKTSQTKLGLTIHYLWLLNSKNFIFLQNQSALLQSDTYFENELFRIGGANSIRGFNEESIFASAYSIFNLEYRFKTNLTSYFYTLLDFAYFNNEITANSENIYSLGLGYKFQTSFGWLNLSYAIGKQEDTSFDFNNSKIHLKIITLF